MALGTVPGIGAGALDAATRASASSTASDGPTTLDGGSLGRRCQCRGSRRLSSDVLRSGGLVRLPQDRRRSKCPRPIGEPTCNAPAVVPQHHERRRSHKAPDYRARAVDRSAQPGRARWGREHQMSFRPPRRRLGPCRLSASGWPCQRTLLVGPPRDPTTVRLATMAGTLSTEFVHARAG